MALDSSSLVCLGRSMHFEQHQVASVSGFSVSCGSSLPWRLTLTASSHWVRLIIVSRAAAQSFPPSSNRCMTLPTETMSSSLRSPSSWLMPCFSRSDRDDGEG